MVELADQTGIVATAGFFAQPAAKQTSIATIMSGVNFFLIILI